MDASPEILGSKIKNLYYYLCRSFPSINLLNPSNETRTAKTQRDVLAQRVTMSAECESVLDSIRVTTTCTLSKNETRK